MAINLSKALQGVSYSLHAIITVPFIATDKIVITATIYQSAGHRGDSFLPIMSRNQVITARGIVDLINAIYPNQYDTAIQAIESHLVQAGGFYQGGSVVP